MKVITSTSRPWQLLWGSVWGWSTWTGGKGGRWITMIFQKALPLDYMYSIGQDTTIFCTLSDYCCWLIGAFSNHELFMKIMGSWSYENLINELISVCRGLEIMMIFTEYSYWGLHQWNYAPFTALGYYAWRCYIAGLSLFEVGIDFIGNWIDLTSLNQSVDSLDDLGDWEMSECILPFDVLYNPVLLKTKLCTLYV